MTPTAVPTAASGPSTLAQKLAVFAGDIKIAHTVFALPFALLSAFMAASNQPGGVPTLLQITLILICMVTARTAAMAANRLLDAGLDRRNPRTARRALPAGALSPVFYFAVAALCAAVFMTACYGFYIRYANAWPVTLGLPVLLFICCYPFLKRFTRLCHYYLGLALALAPICAWVAIRGRLDSPPLWMAGAVVCWTAGFDIIYACQDFASDRELGVYSVPSRLGIGPALWVSRLTHLACVGMLVCLGLAGRPALGPLYFSGVAVATTLLVVEHLLVSPTDLSKVGHAFFTVNGVISVLLGVAGIIDVLV